MSGLVLALGTKWSLFRYYWVLVKFLIAVGATAILLIHTQPIGLLARAAVGFSASDLSGERLQITVASGSGLIVFVVETALAVYKPRGMTPYGWRKQREQRQMAPP